MTNESDIIKFAFWIGGLRATLELILNNENNLKYFESRDVDRKKLWELNTLICNISDAFYNEGSKEND